MSYSYEKVAIGVLLVSLTILLLMIAYKKFLTFLSKDDVIKGDYCVLYSLDAPTAQGEIEIYFTNEKPVFAAIELLSDKLTVLSIVKEDNFGVGGHIVRLDTTRFEDGEYFFQLRSENQKTMKKMMIKNN
jgi:hypothetical protein